MASARIRDLIDETVTILQDNLTDPVENRRNQNGRFVFDHFPKYGQGNKLPRIGVHKISTSHPQQSVGTVHTDTEADIQVSIMVKRGDKYDFDSDGTAEPEEDLADYLHNEAKKAIEDNQSNYRALTGGDYVLPSSSETIKPEGQSFILEALTLDSRIQATR